MHSDERHMLTVPIRVTPVVTAGDASSSTLKFFSKDGRKISVGDCALFKPPQDTPPFIGIIRCLTSGKENKLKLCVNWLYRPAEVKLGEGILLEAAPNEIFYSFHKDEIPASSLLHPCKVAFLPKDVELPSGICTFVCRRFYDITNKCLWWLTDKKCINELQEVDQLLYKTRSEMHATVQQGGRFPKPINGLTSTSQLKSASDSVQNSDSSFPSQGKGKKRERRDQGFEPVKKERNSRMDDGDSGHDRPNINLKSDISKITEKGGLEEFAGVEKLVQLMLSERNEKKIDLVNRSMLAGVIAATEKFDCLSHFVQLKGLPVFDEWLQEVHKRKMGDGSGSKDDRSVDDFLLTLLRALDKLPVNLTALQMCNIGKSVNNLRSHKNIEIQKKARSLVDTWKKRVEAEMDAKSGSNQAVHWSARARLSEVSQGGSKHSGSAEVCMKSSVTQLPASKPGSVKLAQGESTTKSASASPGPTKTSTSPVSASTNLKDGQARNATFIGMPDPHATPRDDKSSSSSQSQNNSQSCSSDIGKTGVVSGKEDARSSPAGSGTIARISGSLSRHQKSFNGFPGPSGVQRDVGSSKNSSLHINTVSEIVYQSCLPCEKVADPLIPEGNSHKLIVKIPNRGRSPAQNASGGSLEDLPVVNSIASPALSDKLEQLDCNTKEKSDSYKANVVTDVNTESWQSNDFKDVLTGSNEGDGSPAAHPHEENCRTEEDARKTAEEDARETTEEDAGKTTVVAKPASSSSGNECKSEKLLEASFNALIDSVVYTEANECKAVGDDAGMNLLASVATSDYFSKSNVIGHSIKGTYKGWSPYPTIDVVLENDDRAKPEKDVETDAPSHASHNEKQKSELEIASAQKGEHVHENLKCSEGHEPPSRPSPSKASAETEQTNIQKGSKVTDVEAEKQKPEWEIVISQKVEHVHENLEYSEAHEPHGKPSPCKASLETEQPKRPRGSKVTEVETEKQKPEGEIVTAQKGGPLQHLECSEGHEPHSGPSPCKASAETESPKGLMGSKVTGVEAEKQKPEWQTVTSRKGVDMHDSLECSEGHEPHGRPSPCKAPQETEQPKRPRGSELTGVEAEEQKPDWEIVTPHKDEHVHENLESSENHEPHGTPSPCKASSETEQPKRPRGSKVTGVETDKAEECTSITTYIPATGVAATDAKVEFDLNEDFNADEGNFLEPNNLTAVGCSAPVQLISSLAFPVSSVSSSLPASITVAAAAKGSFVPPNDLLRTKEGVGWKGSAATSAFRPAEPRKSMDITLGTNSTSFPDASTGKESRLPFDIDLNVADERVLEDLAFRNSTHGTDSAPDLSNHHDLKCGLVASAPICSSGGFDFDLNRLDEPADLGNQSTGNSRRIDYTMHPIKASVGNLNGEASFCMDFDLNNGPAVEVSAEPSVFSHHNRNINVLSQGPVPSLQINNTEMTNFSSRFPIGNTYSAVTMPTILPDRERPFPIVATGGPQRMLGTPTYNPDVYRGPILSSAPAVPFPSTPFQYPVFPFGTTFPLPSTGFSVSSTTYADSSSGGRFCIPPVHSQLLGPAGAVPSHYPGPYVVSLPDNRYNSDAESGRKWGRHGLDLNAGPGGPDIEGRDETMPLASSYLSVASSQPPAEDQSRMYQVPGGVLKRKEPEGGWDGYKQSSWQ